MDLIQLGVYFTDDANKMIHNATIRALFKNPFGVPLNVMMIAFSAFNVNCCSSTFSHCLQILELGLDVDIVFNGTVAASTTVPLLPIEDSHGLLLVC